MDDPKKVGRQDRAQVNPNEEYEVEHLAQKFGVSPAKVRQAEQAVGKSRQKVEEYLTSRK
ncbi:MAG: hypothetical protein JWP89_2594 [Schlesneria sp.]|nr:hypothetical protein [Schlesneria sp.]